MRWNLDRREGVLWGVLRCHQEEMTAAGVPPSVVHWTSVLAAWVNTADMEQASRLLNWMQVTVAFLFAWQCAIAAVIPEPPTKRRNAVRAGIVVVGGLMGDASVCVCVTALRREVGR